MSDNPDSMIGYDPLAWLKEEAEEPEEQSPPSATADSAASAEAVGNEAAPEPESPAVAAPDAPDAGNDSAVIALAETLHVSEVQGLYTALRGALATGQPVEIDGGAVERADGASLQLLAAFVREAGAGGVSVGWRSRSDALVRSAATLGVERMIWPAD